MWNLTNRVCIAIFAGDEGHRDQVLSVDIHSLGMCFVSSSTDNSIKIWSLKDEKVASSIKDSYAPPAATATKPFRTQFIHFPVFSTRKVHPDYVDTARWVGNLLITKSTDHRILLWQASFGDNASSHSVVILREYRMKEAAVCWFVRFGLSRSQRFLACGKF